MDWKLSKQAEEDFEEIFDQIVESQGIDYALDFWEEFDKRCDQIGAHPMRWQVREEYYPGARKALLRQWAIFFSIQDDVVQVDHIAHQRSDPARLLH